MYRSSGSVVEILGNNNIVHSRPTRNETTHRANNHIKGRSESFNNYFSHNLITHSAEANGSELVDILGVIHFRDQRYESLIQNTP